MMFTAATFSISRTLVLVVASTLLLFSCTTVKNAPSRPFVYNYNIQLEGKFSTNERKQLLAQLEEQLHDSIKVRRVQKLVLFETLKNPPVYDSLNADKSVQFMNALLHSVGYLRDTITYNAHYDTVQNQVRTTVNFLVTPQKLFHLDSIAYILNDTTTPHASRDTLQQLTVSSLDKAVVHRGDPFSKGLLSSERERMSDLFRENGYLRFTADELLVLWDTVGLALIRPTLDPIEQARLLEQLKRKRENPTADVEFRLRENEDSSRLVRYHVGNVTIYPDVNADTIFYHPVIKQVGEYRFVSYPGLFKPDKLVDFIYLHKGELYRQSSYLRTANKFSSMSAWRFASVNPMPRPGQDTVDFHIRLTPAPKYHFSTNLEASRNVGNLSGIVQGSLIGLGANLNLQNRNFLKAANLATHNFRYGIELGNNIDSLIQAQQLSFTNTVQFPRMVPKLSNAENIRTIFALNLGSTLRKSFFTVNSFNTSWGWERSVKNTLSSLRFPNIEYNFLKRGQLLDSLVKENASYNYIFNTGLIVSTIASRSIAWGKNKTSSLLSISGEGAGLLGGFIKGSKFLDNNLYRFIKVDGEYRRTLNIRRTALAYRAFVGVGYGLTRWKEDTLNFYLPFFRQYYAGGPNSMRAWPIRRLGPGSTLKSFNRNIAPDRFGDFRLETNLEYRFYMFEVNEIYFNGALFTDIGNVWFLRKNNDFPDGQIPNSLNKLWKDLAIGSGTGLRVDFGFLKLRMDYAYRVKDPSPDILKSYTQNKWFYDWKLLNGQFQLGIDYPF